MRKLWAVLVGFVAYVIWHEASIPADDDEFARRFRESEGRGW